MAVSEQQYALHNYIKECVSNNVPKNTIVSSLVASGWTAQDVDQAYAYLFTPVTQETHKRPDGLAVPQAHTDITHENYPITKLWIFKPVLIVIAIEFAMLLFGYWSPELIFVIPFFLITNPIARKRFRYLIRPESITFYEGKSVESSKHSKTLLYGSIKQVYAKQDLFDMLFSLSSIVIETDEVKTKKKRFGLSKAKCPIVYASILSRNCPRQRMPGLSVKHAEILESIISDRLPDQGVPMGGGIVTN